MNTALAAPMVLPEIHEADADVAVVIPMDPYTIVESWTRGRRPASESDACSRLSICASCCAEGAGSLNSVAGAGPADWGPSASASFPYHRR